MHQTIFAAFDRLCRQYGPPGNVLEIGATPTPDTLLNLPALAGAGRRIGMNLDWPTRAVGFEIIEANANRLPMLENASADLVLCNSTLEHDPRFWLTLAEIRRVTRIGGVAMLGVPGYAAEEDWASKARRKLTSFWPAPLPGSLALQGAAASTATLQVHNFPGDFYRFSEQAIREVFLEGFEVLTIEVLMRPPRIIGVGRRIV
jgi:SAM-dependent methyltransferase